MSVAHEPTPRMPEVESGSDRGAFLRRIETVAGRKGVIEDGLAGRGGALVQDFMDPAGRVEMMQASDRLAKSQGHPFEPLGAADEPGLERVRARSTFLTEMGTVQGRAGVAQTMLQESAHPTDPSRAGPLGQEMLRRLALLGTPEGREGQLQEARAHAARLGQPFQAVQPGEAFLGAGGAIPPLHDRAEMLRAMGTVQGRRDLMSEAKADAFGSTDSDFTPKERRDVLQALQRPESRAVVFGEAEALARHEGRPFEPLSRDAPLYAAEDRARSDVLRDLSTPASRDDIFKLSQGIQPNAGDVATEAGSYQAERNRLVRGLNASDIRATLVDESRREVPGFQPIEPGEMLGRSRQFQPGMGQMRSVELEIGGAPNMDRAQVAAMIGRIDDGLAAESPRSRIAAAARQGMEL